MEDDDISIVAKNFKPEKKNGNMNKEIGNLLFTRKMFVAKRKINSISSSE
jgi:hypothetical protein